MSSVKQIDLHGKAFMIFSPQNMLRRICRSFVSHSKFDPFILAVILLSTILLTLDTPLENPDSTKNDVLFYLDIVISSIFILEFVLKAITFGFIINGKDSYLLNPWNDIDFLIVICAVIYHF
jgi:voltage-dependent calcium channel L type alpha-1D